MNKLEKLFLETYKSKVNDQSYMKSLIDENTGFCPENHISDNIESQKVIGIYKVDFLCEGKFIIEIDGHEYHKTKEQREADYNRERYFQKQNYIIIRFTGTEVYLDVEKCVEDAIIIITKHLNECTGNYEHGWCCGLDFMRKKVREVVGND